MSDAGDDGEVVWKVTESFYGLFCPECGTAQPIARIASGGITICDECGAKWQSTNRDKCLDCGKPLGGNEVLCHSCFEDRRDEQ